MSHACGVECVLKSFGDIKLADEEVAGCKGTAHQFAPVACAACREAYSLAVVSFCHYRGIVLDVGLGVAECKTGVGIREYLPIMYS